MTFAAVCVTILVFTLVVIRLQLTAIDRGVRTEATNLARSVAFSATSQRQSLQPYVQGLGKLYQRDIVIVDVNKTGLADADPSELGHTFTHDHGNEVGQTIADGRVRTFVEASGQYPDGAKQLVVPMRQGGREDGLIVGAVIVEYTAIHAEMLAASIWQLYAVGGAGLICMLVVGFFGLRLGGSVSSRLKWVQQGVERMSRGELSVRLPTNSIDEIGELQVAFNKMAQDLEDSHAKLVLGLQNERASAQRVEYLAYHDKLTGLFNRSMFSRMLEQGLVQARRSKHQLAIMFVDLDRFKNINDSLGHGAGDILLQEVAKRLKSCLRECDSLARLGGDEFVVMLPSSDDAQQVAHVAQKILGVVAQAFTIFKQEFRVTASIGISMYPSDGDDEPTLMKHADIAMYQAKADGKNGFMFYSPDLNRHSLERLAFESSLRVALDEHQFHLNYQPKVDCRTNCMTGVEALLRWNHPELGAVSPAKFIPVAEETGLIVPLGRWVLRTACQQHVAWRKSGLPALRVAVNLSARQFSDDGLLRDVKSILAETGMDPTFLELEITESMLVLDPEKARHVLAGCKRLGIWLSVDDFGTGYSSLSNLRRFPIDTIKVDRSFVRDLPENGGDRAITDAIIGMAKSLSMTVVAEGVETEGQAEFLREHGCDEIQGYYFSRAVDPAVIADFMTSSSAIMSGKDVPQGPRGHSPDSAFVLLG